ncbi:MAG TPA: hypothetical protein VLH12_08670 [Usitatibacter sp.]|nr:hypothetical protein [Usitatibacter sp.]
MAWLYAVPKAPEPGRKKIEREGSRISSLKSKGREPRLPQCGLQYLVDILLEIGPTEQNGMGSSALSYQEILAWQICTGRRLQPWEVGMVRRMSFEWCAESHRAEEHDCPAPWGNEEVTADELRRVSNALRASLRSRGA